MSISTIFAVCLVCGGLLGLAWRFTVLIPAMGLILLSCALASPANSPFSILLVFGCAAAALQVGYLTGAALAEYLPPWHPRPYATSRERVRSITS
jgi:hypothetical protein